MPKGSRFLITGGSGYLGKLLAKKILLLDPSNKVILLDKNTSNKNDFFPDNNRVSFVKSDILDKESIAKFFEGVDYIIHCAAIKYISACENFPHQAIESNILGTLNILELSKEYECQKCIIVSTDKAVNPNCIYGLTKYSVERIVQNFDSGKSTFVLIRSGNFLGSTGSVLPLFYKQIKDENHLVVSDIKVNRLFITSEKIVDHIFTAIDVGEHKDIFIPFCEKISLKDIVEIFKRVYGNNNTSICITGLGKGERINEKLLSEKEYAFLHPVSDSLFRIRNNPFFGKLRFTVNDFDSQYAPSFDNILLENYIRNTKYEEK